MVEYCSEGFECVGLFDYVIDMVDEFWFDELLYFVGVSGNFEWYFFFLCLGYVLFVILGIVYDFDFVM